jgi:hypothetical protein
MCVPLTPQSEVAGETPHQLLTKDDVILSGGQVHLITAGVARCYLSGAIAGNLQSVVVDWSSSEIMHRVEHEGLRIFELDIDMDDES